MASDCEGEVVGFFHASRHARKRPACGVDKLAKAHVERMLCKLHDADPGAAHEPIYDERGLREWPVWEIELLQKPSR